MADEAFAALSDAEQGFWESRPMWVVVALAVSVIAALIASILLALRLSHATSILVIWPAAVVLQIIRVFANSGALNFMGATSAILPIVFIISAVSLVWLSITAHKRGWIWRGMPADNGHLQRPPPSQSD